MIKKSRVKNKLKCGLLYILASLVLVFLSSSCIITYDDLDDDSDTEVADDDEEDDDSDEKSSNDDSSEKDSDDDSDENDDDSDDDSNDDDDSSVVDYTGASDTTVLYINLGDGTWSADNSSFVAITTSKTAALTNVTIKYKTVDKTSTGLVLINAESAENQISYYLTGNLTSGGVKIKTNSSVSTAAKVYLNNVSISSSNYPCLAITNGSAAEVTLSGTNTFVDGRSYGTGYGEEYAETSSNYCSSDGSDSKGTLFCKGNLVLNGSGTLSIKTGYKNCIAAGTDSSTANLTIDGGTYTLVSTGKSGLTAQKVTINDGVCSFTGTGTVTTSNFHKTHGISSDGDIVINGGQLGLTAYNGKGITGDTVTIKGGTITVNSTGVTGFTSENNKTGTYYDADGVKQSNQSIVFAAEGIEGASSITISGGTIESTATDDAINLSTTGKTVTISGGSIYAYSSNGDGIDSNGYIKISGGVIVTCAPTGSEDGLDCGDGGYSITITGGTVASCSGSSNATSPSVSGQKGFVIGGSSTSSGGGNPPNGKTFFKTGNTQSSSSYSGTTIVVLDSDSEVVYTLTVPSASSSGGMGSSGYSNIIFTSPNFSTSGSYTVYTGATVSGGTSFHGLYTTLPTVSSSGTSVSASSL